MLISQKLATTFCSNLGQCQVTPSAGDWRHRIEFVVVGFHTSIHTSSPTPGTTPSSYVWTRFRRGGAPVTRKGETAARERVADAVCSLDTTWLTKGGGVNHPWARGSAARATRGATFEALNDPNRAYPQPSGRWPRYDGWSPARRTPRAAGQFRSYSLDAVLWECLLFGRL